MFERTCERAKVRCGAHHPAGKIQSPLLGYGSKGLFVSHE